MLKNLNFQVSIGHFIGRFIGHFANVVNILYEKTLQTTRYCDLKRLAGETRLSRKYKIS